MRNTRYKRGFTLIEVLVSVGIFLMTMIAISQIFITVIRSERVAYALLNSENNIRNNVELMAKTIRMGKNFDQVLLMSSGGKELCFDYYLDNEWPKLCYKFDDLSQRLERSLETLDNGEYKPLLDPQIKLSPDPDSSGHFYQIGNGSDSQLSFIIQLEAQIVERNINYLFHVETAVTSRYLGQ
jgi:prepilin-type N-terminal cleavage/methylation domain-containing protein